jgi:hypothetical protein
VPDVCVFADLLPVRIAMTMFGKASITYSYALIYLYTPEVFPTVIRGTGLGAGALMSRIGGVLAPFIADLVSIESRDYSKRAVQPKCEVQGAKCAVQT